MNFPKYFPQGCPPSDARAEEIIVFRICNSSQITHNDFKSYYELGKRWINPKDFRYYGVSVFKDKNETQMLLGMPNNKNKYIAEGITSKNCGVIKQGTSNNKNSTSHITWWLFDGAEPEKYFK